jgi:hypothetical protein
MRYRLTLSAACVASLLLGGCGGGVVHVVERPGADASSATQPALAGTADVAQPSDPGPSTSAPAINTPPNFPLDYRFRIATMLAGDFRRAGRGPPEITEPQSGSGPLAGATTVCVQYPVVARGLLRADPTRTDMRRIQFTASRGVFSLGQVEFRRRDLGLFDTCPGEMKPFIELGR